MKRFRKNQKGFTLVEIMSVVAIISMLTAMSMPNFLQMKIGANEAAAQANLSSIAKVMEDIRFTTGNYPRAQSEILNFVNTYYGKYSIISNENSNGGYFTFQGYRYSYETQTLGSWLWFAVPDQLFITGIRSFSLDSGGTFRFAAAGPPSGRDGGPPGVLQANNDAGTVYCDMTGYDCVNQLSPSH